MHKANALKVQSVLGMLVRCLIQRTVHTYQLLKTGWKYVVYANKTAVHVNRRGDG